jgi:signal transduction histidine kinase
VDAGRSSSGGQVKKISTRFAVMMAGAAVVPLLAYGAMSIVSVGEGAQRAVIQGNLDVARRVGEQIEAYVTNNIRVLHALSLDMQRTELLRWQQEVILKNYGRQFREFKELNLLDEDGRTLASSVVGLPETQIPGANHLRIENALISPFSLDDALLPTAVAAVQLPESGWLVGQLRLEQLWKTVDGIHVGTSGYALVVTGDGVLLAHGGHDPQSKSKVARRESLDGHPVVQAMQQLTAAKDPVVSVQYSVNNNAMLGVGARVPTLGWTVIVEQPTREAFAISTSLQRQLVVAIAVALLAMLLVGSLWGRRFIEPILRLTRGTRELAAGRLDTRVAVETADELGQLGTAFNTMADRLVELQEDVRKKERHAMFGRIAIGLVHDLSHPIQTLGNNSKLMLKMWDDPEFRETFKRTIERELAQVRRVLDDLRHVAKPTPVEHFPIDINKTVADLVDSMMPTAQNAGLSMTTELVQEQVFIEGDLFALNRIYRNLIINAIQATPPRGRILVRTLKQENYAVIEVADSGSGIPAERLETIFDDFVTTKRRGLGLGLAISKKIVEQLGGTIAVTSQVGIGSTFSVRFQLTAARPSQIAAM